MTSTDLDERRLEIDGRYWLYESGVRGMSDWMERCQQYLTAGEIAEIGGLDYLRNPTYSDWRDIYIKLLLIALRHDDFTDGEVKFNPVRVLTREASARMLLAKYGLLEMPTDAELFCGWLPRPLGDD